MHHWFQLRTRGSAHICFNTTMYFLTCKSMKDYKPLSSEWQPWLEASCKAVAYKRPCNRWLLNWSSQPAHTANGHCHEANSASHKRTSFYHLCKNKVTPLKTIKKKAIGQSLFTFFALYETDGNCHFVKLWLKRPAYSELYTSNASNAR